MAYEHLIVSRGVQAKIDAYFRDKSVLDDGVALIDPDEYAATDGDTPNASTGPKMTMTDPDGVVKQIATLWSSRLTRGGFRWLYTIPNDATVGTWTGVITAATKGSKAFTDEDGDTVAIVFTVISAPMVSEIGPLGDTRKVLCTIGNVKDLLKPEIAETDTTYDSLFNFLIASCTSIIRSTTKHNLTAQSYLQEYWEPEDSTEILMVDEYPCSALKRVVIDGTEYDLSNFILSRQGELRRIDGYSFPRKVKISVVYRAGYEDNELPDDLKLACTQLVAFVFKERTRLGLQSERIGSYSYTKVVAGVTGARKIPIVGRDIEHILEKYTRIQA